MEKGRLGMGVDINENILSSDQDTLLNAAASDIRKIKALLLPAPIKYLIGQEVGLCGP